MATNGGVSGGGVGGDMPMEQLNPVIQLVVTLPDMTELTLHVNKQIKATEILDMALETLNIEQGVGVVALSLWLVSEDLDLQLKPDHRVMSLINKWSLYLRKYSHLSEYEIEDQKPLIALRRNVFMEREADALIEDPEIIQQLFCEARLNLMDGSYPVDMETACELGGILATIQHGPFDEQTHDFDFYKETVGLLPPSFQQHDKLFTQCCHSLQFSHNKVSKSTTHAMELMKVFLTEASDIPFYGCVFFPGFIERAKRSILKGAYMPVEIGLNRDGIFIIQADKKEPLLGILYSDLHWDINTDCKCEKDDCPQSKEYKKGPITDEHPIPNKCTPCLILQYPSEEEGEQSKVTKVFTKAVKLIDAFIVNCSEMLQSDVSLSPRPPASPVTPASSAPVGLQTAGPSSGDNTLDVVDGSLATGSKWRHAKDTLRKSIKELNKSENFVCERFDGQGNCIG